MIFLRSTEHTLPMVLYEKLLFGLVQARFDYSPLLQTLLCMIHARTE